MDWDEEALKAQFYKRLRENVKDKLMRADWENMGMDMLMNTIVHINNRLHKRVLERKGLYFIQDQTKKSKETPRREQWPKPMQIDTMVRKNQLPKAEIERRRREKLCFKCGLLGH